MQLVYEDSLERTLEAVNDALFWRKEVPAEEKARAANWLASRQGLEDAYAGGFAPLPGEDQLPSKTFIGDDLRRGGGKAHVLGEETSRALLLLGSDSPEVREALARGNAALAEHINPEKGFFCCYMCTVATWRNLAWGGLDKQEQRLALGMETLSEHRLVAGGWRGFPFWYTLSALFDMIESGRGQRYAQAELEWVSSYLKRRVRRLKSWEPWISRKAELGRRILAVVAPEEAEE